MNCEYLQDLRLKLQNRVGDLNQIEHPEPFHYTLQRLLEFVTNNSTLKTITDDLANRYPLMEEIAANVLVNPQVCGSEEENAALCYFVLKQCSESSDPQVEWKTSNAYRVHRMEFEPSLNFFTVNFVQPFYTYLDEHVSDQNFILKLLLHYKQRCELFKRRELFDLWSNEHPDRRGEAILKKNLFEYLHDQGFDIYVEPKSASGEVDLVATFDRDQKIFIEAKVFYQGGSKGRDQLINGFKQAYLYFEDHNSSVGYFIIYKTCEDDLKLSISNDKDTPPFVSYNNRTVYLVTIDIFPHTQTASKRGHLQPIEITKEHLIQKIEYIDETS